MSDKKRPNSSKPPVPARPKNLVVLNSKHLPKPPETFSSENVTNIIKELNLKMKEEENEKGQKRIKELVQKFENSDSEEDTYNYLEPVALSLSKFNRENTLGKVNAQSQHIKSGWDDNVKFSEMFGKYINRNGSASSDLRRGVSVFLSAAMFSLNRLNCQTMNERRGMWEDIFFYVKQAKPLGANLGRRLSHEMADFGFNFKRRLRMALEKRYLGVIPEAPEVEESKPPVAQSQWQRPLPSLPLPPVESKSLVVAMPWYKNVDRKKGEEMLRNGVDGYFLVRPSSNAETYLTLTLWHNNRVYNIPIRKRKDGKFALGTPKNQEQCFDSVENLVQNYQSEKLVLYSNGVQTGKTLLTTHPP